MLPFVPVLLIMSAVCLCKGSDQIPNIIWQSWDDAFLRYPDPAHSYAEIISHPGASVQALSWETLPAVKSHLRCFVVGEMPLEPWAAIIGLLMTAWMFTAYYYLVTHLNTVRVGSYPQDPSPENEISNTLLAQFVFMIPMFTMLSCDYGRTLPYWVLSTLMAVACFGKLDIGFLNRLTSRLQRPLSSVTFRRPVVYALVTFLTPLVSCYAPSFDNAYQWHCVRKLAGKVISLLL